MKFFVLALFFAAFLPSLPCFAMPELTRFGYNTCMACHVSPAGGGLLTPYGRKVSSELLNTWGTEAQTGLFWGALDQDQIEKYLWIGGDVRGAQVHFENQSVKMGRWIKMQAELALAWVHDKWTLYAGIGEFKNDDWQSNSSNYFVKYNPREELSLRAGRFVPMYGLHISDHIAFIRSALGFGLGANRDTTDLFWQSENYALALTHSEQVGKTKPEKANSVQGQIYFLDSMKVGADYWRGQSEDSNRELWGVWGIFGFLPKFYWLCEFDFQKMRTTGVLESTVSYQKIGYSLIKGMDLLALYERFQSDQSNSETLVERRGPGFQWYPVAHFEFSGAWTKQKQHSTAAKEEDYAWLVAHYYF